MPNESRNEWSFYQQIIVASIANDGLVSAREYCSFRLAQRLV